MKKGVRDLKLNEVAKITSTYKKQFIDDILNKMTPLCDNTQLMELNKSLNYHTGNLIISENPNNIDGDYERTNQHLINQFIKTKKLKGLSQNTLRYYETQLNLLNNWSIKSFIEMNSNDLKEYLIQYQELNNCGKVTLNNTRRILSSFWKWLEIEEKIIINPMKRIPSIKTPKHVKKAFTDEEVELLRKYFYSQESLRNTAIFELLLSSGLRLSELASLKKDDLNFVECKGIVMGKGKKERVFYFSERAKVVIEDYINSRVDYKDWLFVSDLAPYNKLGISGIGYLIREAGRSIGITNVHPHRFRRTLATRLVRKGMPIEQVSKILGHGSLSVTMRYVETDKELLKLVHKKYTN